MQLSEHFSLEEMVVSQTASRLGIDNKPSLEIIEELRKLCADVLEPIRTLLGDRPLLITSGYRCLELNSAIAGHSKTSQHMKGQAADFHVPGLSNHQIVVAIKWGHIKFDQLIYEYGEQGWVHVSRSDTPRNQVFSYVFSNGEPTAVPFT